jgi:penicillin-binding protein 1C
MRQIHIWRQKSSSIFRGKASRPPGGSAKKTKRVLPWLLILGLAALAAAGTWLFGDLPSLANLDRQTVLPSVRILDRKGRLLYEILAESGGRHTVVPLGSIASDLRRATVATEDRSFYQNTGVDFSGIVRSVWLNLRGGETVAGGSTITQQVARGLLLSETERSQRTLRRKLREVVLAWELTRACSKDQILELYLNQTYYGGLSYGVEAAAQTYFGKPASDLDLAESALLAGLPQAPAAYNPFLHLDAARARQHAVLELMVKAGDITAAQQAQAEREPLSLAVTPYPMEAPHFVQYVRSQLDQLFGPADVARLGGLEIVTTLDLDWEKRAEQAITLQLEKLRTEKNEDGLGSNLNNAALVAVDPASGDILAMVGSPDYRDAEHSGQVNMAVLPRQPGSALKPIIYASMFDPTRAAPMTAASMLLDVRTNFVTHDGQAYSPENYDGKEHGPVLAREALASSLNIPAVLTLQSLGLPDLFAWMNRYGFAPLGDPNGYDLSLALGGGEVTLLDLTAAYGAFANGGYRVIPRSILSIRDPAGSVVYQAGALPQTRILDARVAWLIADILSDDSARVTGFGRNSILKLDRPAAVKTGTTTDFHDNWTVGFTPDLVVGVWAGNADHAAMRNITGVTGAAPIWHQFMRTVLEGTAVRAFQRPPGMLPVEICALSGSLPSPACPYRRTEWFIAGTQPTQVDSLYQQVTLDRATGLPASAAAPAGQVVTRLALNLPASARAWAHAQGLLLVSDLPGAGQAGPTAPGGAANTPQLQLTAPADRSVYQFTAGMDGAAQSLRLSAASERADGVVTFFIDGSPVGSAARPPFEAWWPLSVGSHQAWAEFQGPDGQVTQSERVHFEVK